MRLSHALQYLGQLPYWGCKVALLARHSAPHCLMRDCCPTMPPVAGGVVVGGAVVVVWVGAGAGAGFGATVGIGAGLGAAVGAAAAGC
jgi:hypothetical protein